MFLLHQSRIHYLSVMFIPRFSTYLNLKQYLNISNDLIYSRYYALNLHFDIGRRTS